MSVRLRIPTLYLLGALGLLLLAWVCDLCAAAALLHDPAEMLPHWVRLHPATSIVALPAGALAVAALVYAGFVSPVVSRKVLLYQFWLVLGGSLGLLLSLAWADSSSPEIWVVTSSVAAILTGQLIFVAVTAYSAFSAPPPARSRRAVLVLHKVK